jgi:hypothetical protein
LINVVSEDLEWENFILRSGLAQDALEAWLVVPLVARLVVPLVARLVVPKVRA